MNESNNEAPKRRRKPKKFGRRYPWKKWFSQNHFVIRRGIHFDSRPYTMAQQVRNAAGPKRFNLRVSVSISEEDPDAVEVTVLSRRGVDAKKKRLEDARKKRLQEERDRARRRRDRATACAG